MKLNGIVIRSKGQMDSMQKELRDAIKSLLKQDDRSVPVVYQYLHNRKTGLEITNDNTMGYMTNIRMKDGALIGDIEIYDILRIASNFTGVIDNLAATIQRNGRTPSYKVDAFIIYDKIAKERVLQKKQNMENRLAMPGSVPLISGEDTNIAIKKATKEILADFERRFGKEQPNISNEGGTIDE